MPVAAVYGLPGKGKSLFLCQYVLTISDKYRKPIVCNFQFKPSHLAQLAKMMNLSWVLKNIGDGIIYYVNPNLGFQDMLVVPDAVICIDEVALYAPRKDGGTPMSIRNGLSMSRKLSQYIVFSCQYPAQIDEGLKDYVDEVFYCNGTTVWSEEFRNEALILKNCKRFTQENFKVWYSDPKIKRNPVKSKILANKTWQGILSCTDAMTFAAYNSFVDFRKMKSKLPDSDAIADEYPYCLLSSSVKHRLDYWPQEILITPLVQDESLDTFYKSDIPDHEDQEDDIYNQVQSGRTTYSSYSKKPPTRRQIEQDITTRPRTLVIWRIWGNNRIFLHKHSNFMTKLYSKLPKKSLPGLIKLDKLLRNLSLGKYKNEEILVKIVAAFGAFLFFLQILDHLF